MLGSIIEVRSVRLHTESNYHWYEPARLSSGSGLSFACCTHTQKKSLGKIDHLSISELKLLLGSVLLYTQFLVALNVNCAASHKVCLQKPILTPLEFKGALIVMAIEGLIDCLLCNDTLKVSINFKTA